MRDVRNVMTRHLLTVIALVGLSFGALDGCTKETPAPPSPEQDPKQADRAKLEHIVAQDLRASKAMTEADTAARKNDITIALDAIDHRGRPAIDAGLRAATEARPEMKTEWGRTRLETFVKLLEDRRAELEPYREAVKTGNLEKLIAAIESQAKIERRAIAAAADTR